MLKKKMQQRKSLKILCVDDEPELLKQIAELVDKAGFEALTAQNVEEALELVYKHGSRIALILSDYSMEGKSGFDFRNELLTKAKQIPFVLISGHISREDALKAVELKISAFVSKPFRNEELIQTVANESKDRIAAIREDDELLGGFLQDATGLVEEMESLILSLEDNPSDIDAINRIFACAHTIKGASGFFKPDTVHRFTHRYEDYLSTFKKNPEKLNSHAISVLLKGLDTIKSQISRLEEGIQEAESLESLIGIFSESPVDDEKADQEKKADKVNQPAIHGPTQQQKKSEEIRVSIDLLNDFMEKSGEITVLRNMINKVLRAIEAGNPSDPNILMLGELLSEMHKVISSMQDQLGELRKVPAKQVFKPLSRTLRDLTVGLKKQITLETVGDDLRIDYTLAETLNKCLVHMLRNSADHGIETPEQRTSSGKPSNGTIKISCSETSEDVVIKMEDDGRGIDPARIRSKAIEKKLIAETNASKMSDAAIRMLIFEPGFSTAEQVTDVSGRGVGTDMVKTTVTSIGGRILLESEIGKGTVFTLCLPIPKSVLIINSLMVRVSNNIFAVPQEKILRVVRISKESKEKSIRNIGDALFFQAGEDLLPVVSLSKSLSLLATQVENNENISMLLIQGKNGNYCLQVDDILDSEEIVVKKFGKWFNTIKCYLGATFFGDGKIGLILDADGISEKVQLGPHHISSHSDALVTKSSSSEESSLLLVDIGCRSKYAIKQSEIFRLEELKTSQVRWFDHQMVTIYRDQTMPIFPVKNFLDGVGEEQDDLLKRASILSVVIKQQNRFYAFAVQSIGDFVDQEKTSSEKSISFDADSRTCIVQNQIVTIVNLEHLLSKIKISTSEQLAA